MLCRQICRFLSGLIGNKDSETMKIAERALWEPSEWYQLERWSIKSSIIAVITDEQKRRSLAAMSGVSNHLIMSRWKFWWCMVRQPGQLNSPIITVK